MKDDWVSYWRHPEWPVEAMHAHFREHVYHRHSHAAYSFGVTDEGAQTFRCRGGAHTSAAGMVMAFNPEDPHDGRRATEPGFTYRIVHLSPGLVRKVLTDAAGRADDRPAPLPLFPEPVVPDPVPARALRRLHAALAGGASELVRCERLTDAVLALARRGGSRPPVLREAGGVVARARELLVAAGPRPVSPDELAAAAGCSRFALYRGFRAAYGMAPSDYQRQLRLRAARELIRGGTPLAEVAAATGFADQSHLSRWFVRMVGVTPGAYARAAG